MAVTVVRSVKALREALMELGKERGRIGFVPTMGALHAGHISLIEKAKKYSDAVVVSIFVNPMQFGPNEDYGRYPRKEAEDLHLLEQAGGALVFLPTVEEIYPEGFATTVSVPALKDKLCGAFRPGHFDGVATVVAKLLLQTLPDMAVFGEKDFQQLVIIRRMVQDLNIPVGIVAAPTMREADGLAMSSRNAYLNGEQRKIAASLYRVLNETAVAIKKGAPVCKALTEGKEALLSTGFTEVQYLEYADAESLESLSEWKEGGRLLVAAKLGAIRLIDNIEVTQ